MRINYLTKNNSFIYCFILSLIVLIVIFTSGCTTSSTKFVNTPQSPESKLVISTETPTVPTTASTYVVMTYAETQRDKNIKTIKNIVEEYHRTHTYSLADMYVCAQMAQDVWNMVETQKINAIIKVGTVDQDINTIQEANHAWVLAEVSPGEWLAMETTAGYLVCVDSSICAVNNPRYYKGWNFNNPKELQDYIDKIKHPCSAGYVLGTDNLCHQACGGSTYCTGNSICINGQCRDCDSGYILGEDLKCHQPCGSSNHYCLGDSVCINGQCRGCDPGYILGEDLKCHQPCGTTNNYCTGDSVCFNGVCQGCNSGYYLGTDLLCHKL